MHCPSVPRGIAPNFQTKFTNLSLKNIKLAGVLPNLYLMERIMACITPNSRRVEYIDPIHGSLDGASIHGLTYTPTPPRSLNYRRSGVQDWTTRKPTPPRSLNYRRSSVQDRTRREYKGQIPPSPPQPQLATGYVEAGAKLREGRGGQSHGEDVSKLGDSRDMEYPNIADGDSVAHEV